MIGVGISKGTRVRLLRDVNCNGDRVVSPDVAEFGRGWCGTLVCRVFGSHAHVFLDGGSPSRWVSREDLELVVDDAWEFWGCLETTACCLCLRAPGRFYGGHVTHGEHKVIAGWCEPCRARLDKACCARLRDVARPWTVSEFMACDLVGWCGHWVDAMGMRLRGSPSMRAVSRAAEART